MSAAKFDDLRITHLVQKRVAQATEILSRAFYDDPILSHYFGEPKLRREAYRIFFGTLIRMHLKFGHVYSANSAGKLIGVAVWRPPNAIRNCEDRLSELRARNRIRNIFPGTADELFRGFESAEKLHPSIPHWYLCFVGVDTPYQAHGIGRRLLLPVLHLADRTRTLCYLETPFERTLPFYRNLGFRKATKSNPFRGAPSVWTMVRRPSNSQNG